MMLFSKTSKVFCQNLIMKKKKKNVPISSLKETVNRTLEKYALFRKRYARATHIPFINKTLSIEIMKRSHLKNKFLNMKSEIDWRAYKKQQNYVVSLMRKEKESFYGTLATSVKRK